MNDIELNPSTRNSDMRLFFGIGLDKPSKAHIVDWLSQHVDSKRPFTKPENLHLTLAFLGQTPVHFVPELINFAQSLCFTPFSLDFEHIDYWQETGIFFLKPNTLPHELSNLAHALRTRGEEFGLYINPYAFSPHITLCRGNKNKPLVTAPIQPFSLTVDAFHLYHSHQSEQGLVYEPIKRFPAR